MTRDYPIEVLHLPTRVYRALLKAGIDTVGQVRSLSADQLLKVPRLGPKLVTEHLSAVSAFPPAA